MRDYPEVNQTLTKSAGICPRQETLRERLEFKQKMLREQLTDVEAALKILNDTPQLEAFHDAITKAGY